VCAKSSDVTFQMIFSYPRKICCLLLSAGFNELHRVFSIFKQLKSVWFNRS